MLSLTRLVARRSISLLRAPEIAGASDGRRSLCANLNLCCGDIGMKRHSSEPTHVHHNAVQLSCFGQRSEG